MLKNHFSTLLLTALFLSTAITNASDFLLIADFNQGNQNALGGYFNKFERAPSKASVGLTEFVARSSLGKSLEIKASKDQEGYCGAWIHLFDLRADDREYLDVSEYRYLSFWVKGEKGGERFAIKISDKRLIELEDSVNVGETSEFLLDGITQRWQEILVPISRLSNLDKTQLGGITLEFNATGNHKVYVDDISLKKSRSAVVSSANRTADETDAKADGPAALPKALWVWTTFEILENKNNEQNTLFETCKRENIDRLWLQAPLRYEPGVDFSANIEDLQPAEFKTSLLLEDKLRAFIRKAHEEDIKIEALDGYPEFAQKP